MRLPKGFREGHGGDLACSHRDMSVCPECARVTGVVEVYGQHFWIPDPVARRTLLAQIAARDRKVAK